MYTSQSFPFCFLRWGLACCEEPSAWFGEMTASLKALDHWEPKHDWLVICIRQQIWSLTKLLLQVQIKNLNVFIFSEPVVHVYLEGAHVADKLLVDYFGAMLGDLVAKIYLA